MTRVHGVHTEDNPDTTPRSRWSGRQDEDGLKRLPPSDDNDTFVSSPSHPLRWEETEKIGLSGVGDLEGWVTRVKGV